MSDETKVTQEYGAEQIQVLRFSNLDVLRRFEDVCAEIDRTARSRAGLVP